MTAGGSSAGSESAENQPPLALIPEQRRQRMVTLLEQDVVLSVRELTTKLGVSHMTVRRDIAALEAEGRAVSVTGGVRLARHLHSEPSYEVKAVTHLDLKEAIAAEAASRVSSGAAIYLDAGTTVAALVPALLTLTDLTVVTNDFTTLSLLMDHDLELVHVGGHVENRNRSSIGRLAAATLRQINVDVAFLSASSWDGTRGVTTPSESKVDVKHAAMEVASTSILLADATKYGTFAMHRVAPLTAFDEVITDTGFSGDAASQLRAGGVPLTLAGPEG
ncbi:DeoR/GlpR family DNA-binding transcription regulator [Georgenia halophila]|uniref:DeoR/GlpR family DNA-binding transcription regulator n=1 Tax=Georgenia halophila TaxID=620889 RepID=A0ABP8LPC8_9MICO